MMKFIGIVVQEVLLFLFWFVIVTNFIPMADTDFYALVVIFLYLPLAFSIPFFIFSQKLVKYRKKFYAFLFAGTGLLMAGYAVYHHFDNKVPVIYDGVDITRFQPFSDGLPRLSQPASLKLEKDLPILDGALSLYPVYAAFATAVYPEKPYPLDSRRDFRGSNRPRNAWYDGGGNDSHEVHFTNTAESFKGLLSGRVDICFLLEISADQKEMAREKGVQLVFTPIGREAFVFIVNRKNPVSSLTLAQVRSIYSGKITHWKALGGKGEIKAYQRNANSGSQTALEHLMGDEKLMEPPRNAFSHGMGHIISEIARYKNYQNAIGFTFNCFLKEMVGHPDVRTLAINGVLPSPETVENGTYPLISTFYAVTRKNDDQPHVKAMLAWMVSDQGQYLVKMTGYAPICAHPHDPAFSPKKPPGGEEK